LWGQVCELVVGKRKFFKGRKVPDLWRDGGEFVAGDVKVFEGTKGGVFREVVR